MCIITDYNPNTNSYNSSSPYGSGSKHLLHKCSQNNLLADIVGRVMGKAMKVMKGMIKKAKKTKEPKGAATSGVSSEGHTDNINKAEVKKKPATATFNDSASILSKALSTTPSLNEKLRLLRGSSLPVNEKVKLMNQKFTHPDWNKVNGRFVTAKASDTELQEASEAAPKNLQRTLQTAWVLDPSKGEIFNSLTCGLISSHTMTKTLQWESEKMTLNRWSQDELDKHLSSGRVIWREDPYTPGVYEYKDTKNISEMQQIQKVKKKTFQQKSEIVEESFDDEMNDLEDIWNTTNIESRHSLSLRGRDGEGKGSSSSKGKGKGHKNALEDDPKKKLKSAKAMLSSTIKSLGAWGFSQKKMMPKVKKTLQQNIKKLEKQSELLIKVQEGSSEDTSQLVADTMVMIAECKQVME